MSEKIYLSATHRLRPDWKELVEPPKKPANWKDETFEARLGDLWEEKKRQAHDPFKPDLLTSQITSVSAASTSKAYCPEPGGLPDVVLDLITQVLSFRTAGEDYVFVGNGCNRILRSILLQTIPLVDGGLSGLSPVESDPKEVSLVLSELWSLPNYREIDLYRHCGLGTHGVSYEKWLRVMAGLDDEGIQTYTTDALAQYDTHVKIVQAMGI